MDEWLKYYDDSGSTVTGKLNPESVIRLYVANDSQNYPTVWARVDEVTSAAQYRVLASNTSLTQQSQALAKIDDILVNGN